MDSRDSVATGIIVADADRLILRPFRVPFSRRELLRLTALFVSVTLLFAIAFAYLFRAHVSYPAALLAGIAVALLHAYRFTTQVTFIALRSATGIVVETENRILRTKRRKLLHAYAGIREVRLRSRVNPHTALPGVSPMGAYLHYDVVLEKQAGSAVLWYTRYPECAVQIAETIASFAGVEVIDPEQFGVRRQSRRFP